MRRFLTPFCAAALLVSATPQTNAQEQTELLYVTQFRAPAAFGYAARGRNDRAPVCQIPGVKEVNAIGVDRSGTLWLPQQDNDGGGQSIVSFGAHCGPAGLTLKDPNGFPTAIAFDSHGTNFVMDAQTNPSGFGLVAVFPRDQTSPTRTLRNSAFHLLTAIGVDAHDDVFVVTTSPGNHGQVVEFAHGRMPGAVLKGVTTDGIPGGALLFDRSGNMLLDDYAQGTLDVYSPPFGRKPVKAHMRGISWQCALNPRETKLACADTGNGSVDVYAYPSLTYSYSITSGLAKVATVVGVAYDPAAR